MPDINIGKAPANSAVLPFYATGAIAFLALCLLMLMNAHIFTGHFFNPRLLSMVHIAALGWGTMIIFGAAHQLLPVICEQDLFSGKLASASWYTLTAGSALLAVSFWNFHTGWVMIAGGSMILLSALFFAVNAVMTSRICNRYSLQKLFIISATGWLLLTASIGLLLAINLRYPFFARNHLDILKLHAHAGLAGWFLQLITGVSSKLIPMFLLSKSTKDRYLYYSFVLQNGGLLLFLTDGYLAGYSDRVLVYACLVLAGIVCWVIYLQNAFVKRIRKKTDILMKQSFASFGWLLLAIAVLPVAWIQGQPRWAILYGFLLLMGWITGIILGKTFKTLPFIVWNGHYKNLNGKVKVPLPKQLFDERLVHWQFRLFIVAMLVCPVGILSKQLILLRAGFAVWLLIAVLYVYNVMKTLLHKTHTLS